MPEAGVAVEEEAAGIICSLRAGDLAGWTPPWKPAATSSDPGRDAATKEQEEEKMAWPAVTRGKRSRSSRRRSPSGSGSAAKGRWARGSPASPLDYSGASTSGGEDGAFCSPPPAVISAPAGPSTAAAATPAPASSAAKLQEVGFVGGRRRPSILPVPVTPPRPAGQRSRKKMRLPEVQQLVLSLAAENDGLRQEMQSLRRACTSLSKENTTLETRLEHSSSSKRKRIGSGEQQEQKQGKPNATERSAATSGFVLPDLNIPAQDIADGSVVAAP